MRTILLFAFALLLASPALAEDLSGRYQGPAPQNAILDLTQTGNTLQGQLHAPNGIITLTGQVTGSETKGTIVVPGVGQASFEAQLMGQTLRMRIFDPGKTTEVVFTRIPAAAGQIGALQPQPQPQAQPSVTYFVWENGVNVGPFTLQQMTERIGQGATPADQQVWKSDTQTWARADALPELQAALQPAPAPGPAAVAYYVSENGTAVGPLSLQQVLERIPSGATTPDQQVWKSDTQTWGRADALPELQAALQPAPAPAPTAVMYYVAESGAAVGPLTLQQMLERVQAGTAARDQQVWKTDTQVWVRADSLPELQAAFPHAAAAPIPTPPPPPSPVAVMYYVAENGAAVGPLSLQQVLERAQGGGLTADQQVWKTDTQVWGRADALPELQAALAQPAPAPAAAAAPTAPAAPQANAPQPAPAADATETETDEALLAAGLQIATADNPEQPSQALNDTAACFVKVLASLTPEEKKQFLVDIRAGTAPAGGRRLDQEFPGLVGALERLEARIPGLGRALERCG